MHERVRPPGHVTGLVGPRAHQGVAGEEDPQQPQHDHRDQGECADQRDPPAAEVVVPGVADDRAGLQPDQQEHAALEQERDRAPVHPLRDL
jgi:hypothetical protein